MLKQRSHMVLINMNDHWTIENIIYISNYVKYIGGIGFCLF